MTHPRSVQFADKVVGDGHPVFVTFEAGPTHDGLDSALKLVTLAVEAGADAVKFQILDPDRLVADRKLLFSYDILVDRETGRRETVTEPLYDILCRRVLSFDEWRKVKAHADGLGLAFFATVGFSDEVALVKEIGCHSIKIASGDVNHFPLIRECARTGLCLQLDTGSSSIGEVERAVDIAREEGNENIIVHQCPSGYPARRGGINLNVIPTLKRIFPFPIAFSDHTPGWEMDVAAVALGANLVEKTITLDRATPSVEHIMSLEPAEMKAFVTTIRAIERALGSPRRILHAEEKRKRDAVRRSTYLAAPVAAGQPLGDAQVFFRRPGFGLTPDLYEDLRTACFVRDLPAGHMLRIGDLG